MGHDDLHALLIEHTAAWNSHDLDRLMGLFADDCVFEASSGPGPHGVRFEGATAKYAVTSLGARASG